MCFCTCLGAGVCFCMCLGAASVFLYVFRSNVCVSVCV